MSFDGMKFEFESEAELPEDEFERKRIPEDTVALVQVRAEKDRELGDFRHGESQYGPWMIIPFEVAEGEYKGEWASMMTNPKTSDRRFRRLFEVVTGVDISKGGSMSYEEFKEKLLSGVFKAKLGPEKRKNKETGELEETGYTRVFEIISKEGERENPTVGAGSDTDVPGDSAEVADDDIPF